MVSLMHVELVDTDTKWKHDDAQEGGLIGEVLSVLRRGGAEQHEVTSDKTSGVFIGDDAVEKTSLPELAVRVLSSYSGTCFFIKLCAFASCCVGCVGGG